MEITLPRTLISAKRSIDYYCCKLEHQRAIPEETKVKGITACSHLMGGPPSNGVLRRFALCLFWAY